MVMLLPTMFGSELNNRFQKAWLRMATGVLPGVSSSARRRRPYMGLAPNSVNRLEDVRSASTRSG